MRHILHVDLNGFYASVECLHRPELAGRPVAVGGDETARHGIVLAKNEAAKAYDIRTGDVLWEARQKCPGLVIIRADFPLYLRFSRLAKDIYRRYTDQVESFGIDEAWLDVTGSLHGRSATDLAETIRQQVKDELGITVSIGVSWNKIFAKLGSDMKKPDAVTTILPENYRRLVWPLPASDLLYVGRATKRKLAVRGIHTIGDLACADPQWLRRVLGKWGLVLHQFANGADPSPVDTWEEASPIKSIGNSTTAVRDLCTDQDVQVIFTILAESVAMRLRENGFKGRCIGIHLRTNTLAGNSLQATLPEPTAVASEIIAAAMALFRAHYQWPMPLRSIGVRMSQLEPADKKQLALFENPVRQRSEQLEETIDHIRHRFGNHSIVRSTVLLDKELANFDPKTEHVIHPLSYFKEGAIL